MLECIVQNVVSAALRLDTVESYPNFVGKICSERGCLAEVHFSTIVYTLLFSTIVEDNVGEVSKREQDCRESS